MAAHHAEHDNAIAVHTGCWLVKNLPKDTTLQVGVLDIRTNAIEKPELIADRVRQVLKYVPAEKVTLSTDCGMKPLARMVAKMKLKALTDGAAIVRKEIGAK
jgi:5-methyltetrahydropteroyltriglutamate--homocysteine methyltransferase